MKLCIFLLLFLLWGCSRRETVPYDNRRSLALLDACEAIIADDNIAAMSALQQMEIIPLLSSQVLAGRWGHATGV